MKAGYRLLASVAKASLERWELVSGDARFRSAERRSKRGVFEGSITAQTMDIDTEAQERDWTRRRSPAGIICSRAQLDLILATASVNDEKEASA